MTPIEHRHGTSSSSRGGGPTVCVVHNFTVQQRPPPVNERLRCLLLPPGNRSTVGESDRPDRSNPPELPFQIVAAKKQGRGSAVRAVVRVVGQMPLGHQGGHLLRR